MASKKLMAQNERICAEIERLTGIFHGLSENTKKVVDPLLKNAAFMTITLEDLQEVIKKKGAVSKYKNGENQFGTKKSPEVEIYNVMIKNLASIIKQLTDIVPMPAVPSNPVHESDTEKKPDPFEIIAGRGRLG
ncbi:hypothetical protein SDC9_115846 [bioreactor metagenome]|uniref:Uncharacterized protein n=1 Tax=bioreactor metagenome TaxID=1076179 RepID=A0A645BWB0_9ZZZZ